MKRVISVALCLLMTFSLLTGCKKKTNEDLVNARDYLVSMYQKGEKNEPMQMLMDTDVLSSVTVDGISYSVTWTVTVTKGAADSVKIGTSEKANHVLVDVPELPDTDVLFTLTATVKDDKGNTEVANFSYKVTGLNSEGSLSDEEIITQAYALENGQALEGTHSLMGTITKIDTPYDPSFKNITVTIAVTGFEDKPIKCYRLTGDGADKLAVGNVIVVTGTIKNYEGTVEFDAGCVFVKLSGEDGDGGVGPVITDVAKIMKDAYALKKDTELNYTAVLTGKVIAVDEAYDPNYKNITVTISIAGYDGKPIKCYRMKGTGVESVQKNDTITVSGKIKNHNGIVEFDLGCVMTKRVSGGGVIKETDPAKIVAAAFALKPGENLGYDVTLTGKVKAIDSAYDPSYQNISVIITVEGKDILCYRMKGTDIDKVVGGDTITVSGSIKNYNGTIEFDTGCTMRKRVSGGVTVLTDPKAIVDAAFSLAPGATMPYSVSLTGKILKINDPYSSQYNNITVTIEVEGATVGKKELKCYRMKGSGADSLKVGDVITVTGVIKNYQHSSGDCEVEFDSGCTFKK